MEDKYDWYKKEFNAISKKIDGKDELPYLDYLRIRNYKMRLFSSATEEKVKEVTIEAFKLAEGNQIVKAIDALTKLHGVGIAVASAILAMRLPQKYCIIDKITLSKLDKQNGTEWEKELAKGNSNVYEDYVKYMRKTKPANMTLREYEFKLYTPT